MTRRWTWALTASFVVAFLANARWAVYAGTTGSLVETVRDSRGGAVASARITIVSPSQRENTTTNARGAFSSASLAPDAYEISVQKDGFEPLLLHDVRITADQTHTVAAVVRQTLRQIGRVSTPGSALVRPGTTRAVYSVSPAVTEASEAIGAGANLQNAYAAISIVERIRRPAHG